MSGIIDDRKVSIRWAKLILEKDNWCILDTETTGLGDSAEIVEIAAITSTSQYRSLVKPCTTISEGASKIHGITEDQVSDAPYFESAFLETWKTAKGKDLIIYNADFDLSLIRQSLKARGIQIAFPTSDRRGCRIFVNGGSIHCAMHYYSQWIGEWNDYHENYKWQKLPGGDHSALGDCRATLEIIKQMAGADGD
jgi:DNA polymerase III subunit epsilon